MRRQIPQRVSPVWLVTTYRPGKRSPQREQSFAIIGRIVDRHSWQTGSREILVRGLLQMRQSEGNSVVNRLSARPFITAAHLDGGNTLPLSATSILRARVWSPLLLKTNLLIQWAFWGANRAASQN